MILQLQVDFKAEDKRLMQKKTNAFCISDLFIYLLMCIIIHLDFSDPMSSMTEWNIREDIANS